MDQDSTGPDVTGNMTDTSGKNEMIKTIKEVDSKVNEVRMVLGRHRTIMITAEDNKVGGQKSAENDWSSMKLGMIDRSQKLVIKGNSRLSYYQKPNLQ
jgi:hypothetical protein